MASHTKVEPIERSTVKAPSSSVGVAQEADVEGTAGDRSAPESSIEASVVAGTGDDEDVSLDELMMSDSGDGDEPEPAAAEETPAPPVPPSVQSTEAVPETEPTAALEHDPYALDPEDDEAAALAAAAAAQEAAAQEASAEAEARAVAARRAADAPSVPRPAPSRPEPKSAAAALPEREDEEEPTTGQVAAVQVVAPPAAVAAGPSETLEGDDLPLGVDLDGTELPPPSAESAGASVAPAPPSGQASGKPHHDGPLPSFAMQELAPANARRGHADDERAASRVNARPLATPLSHLSEAGDEDDDDAVTHIGLPVVPEADYSALGATGFQVADPGALALSGFDPDLSFSDARRATTRVLPRVDPPQVPVASRATRDTNPSISGGRRAGPGVGAWLSGVFRRYRPEARRHDIASSPAQRRTAWLLDTVLPPLSLMLFGSGIGAGIMLLQPDRGSRSLQAQTVQSLKEAPAKRPVTLEERAEAGDGDALFKITNMAPSERSSRLTLALERGYQAQKQNEFKEFQKSLQTPPGLAQPNLTNRFLGYATSPETMLAAFADLLAWPGSAGPEVLYAVWEKAPGGSRAASLAQQLLHSEDQRNKATPALRTALDLRSATSCEDYQSVLPAVQRDGDQRCSATLRALKHRDGCGDDGQQDCFACLRDTAQLDDALTAIEGRVPPQL
jgi:hypothetical protein